MNGIPTSVQSFSLLNNIESTKANSTGLS